MSLHPDHLSLSLSLGLAAVSHLVVVVGFALFESSSTATQLPPSFPLPSLLRVLLLLPLLLPPSFNCHPVSEIELGSSCPTFCSLPALPRPPALCWVVGNDRARAGRRGGVGVRSREQRRGGPPHLTLLLHLLSPSLKFFPSSLFLSSPSLTRGRRLSNLSRAPALYELLE